jgi:hypothetical protein
MKLFIWPTLGQSTAGVIFALARNIEQAKRMVRAKDATITYRNLELQPQIINAPAAFVVWGGE